MSGDLAVASEAVFDLMYRGEQRHEDEIAKGWKNYEPKRQDGESDEDWSKRYQAALTLRRVVGRLRCFTEYSLKSVQGICPDVWTKGYIRHMSHHEYYNNVGRLRDDEMAAKRFKRDREGRKIVYDHGREVVDYWDKRDAIAGTGILNPGAFRRPDKTLPPENSIEAGSAKKCTKHAQFVLNACCRYV